MIEKLGGEILVSRLWEERRLAYPIKSHRKGTYWLTYFRLDATQLDQLCEIRVELSPRTPPENLRAMVAYAREHRP